MAAVNPNPVDPETLIGLFPTLSAGKGVAGRKAFVGMAISCDGAHFSSLRPVLRSMEGYMGRTTEHPVDGIVARGDEASHLFQTFCDMSAPTTQLLDNLSGSYTPRVCRMTHEGSLGERLH